MKRLVIFLVLLETTGNAQTTQGFAGNLNTSQWLSTLTQSEVDLSKQDYAQKALFQNIGSREPIDFVTANNGTKTLAITIPASFNGVTFYKLNYSTVDLHGNPTVASGEVILPFSVTNGGTIPSTSVKGMISYQHGTVTDRASAPSADQQDESLWLAFYFASRGYIVVAADYLGLGDNPGPQDYLNAQTEASAARDMLRASRNFFTQNGITEPNKLFLMGYSQGGHSTLALQQLLETDSAHEFQITASAPMAGPYHLSQTAKVLLSTPYPYVTSAEMAFLINADINYGIVSDLSTVIQAPYAAEFPTLFDGTHDLTQVAQRMPESPLTLLSASLVTALANVDLTSPFVQELVQNDLYHFVPTTPTLLLGGGGDHEVPFEVNAQFTYDTMKANQANVVDLVKIGTLDHPNAVIPAFFYVQEWFDGSDGH